MKLTEFIKKLQRFEKQIKENCSHPQNLWDIIDFVVENEDGGYDNGNYYHLDNKISDYCIGLLPGCHCQSGLTIVFKKEVSDE